jgi:hypothetical protein
MMPKFIISSIASLGVLGAGAFIALTPHPKVVPLAPENPSYNGAVFFRSNDLLDLGQGSGQTIPSVRTPTSLTSKRVDSDTELQTPTRSATSNSPSETPSSIQPSTQTLQAPVDKPINEAAPFQPLPIDLDRLSFLVLKLNI